jgi:hypothetical protein
MKPKTVYLLGKGDGWDEIKTVPKGSTIYGVNDACLRTPEVTHTFHMHDLKGFHKNKVTESSTKLLINHCKDYPEMPLYTVKCYKEIPNAILYPLEDVIDHFNLPAAYFSSGPEYMIAWAIREGFDEMTLYGLNMSVHEEYHTQKPGMEFWIGMALGKGMKVNLQHNLTSLLKTRSGDLYGYFMKQWRNY